MHSVSIIIALALLCTTTAFHVQSLSRALHSRSSLEMKGKGSRVPINQRGEYMKQQKMMEMRKQLETSKPEGVPVFKVFVRPKAGGLWIPVGDLAGDKRATSLVNAWMSGFLTDTYKNQLDMGVAKSIFSQDDAFAKNIIENYKPFNKFKKDDLVFGYKVEFEGKYYLLYGSGSVLTGC
jgi:Family of unknown function (DUF6523)